MKIFLIILIIILLICIVYFMLTYNKFIILNNDVKEAFSTMDVYLKKRWDLIPNLVETIKGYTKHEEKTIIEITKLRSNIYDKMNSKDKITTNELITNELSNILLLSEKYPELKADGEFLNLQKELSRIEDEIAQARKYYNAVVRIYNNKVEMIPSNIVAKTIGYKVMPMFSATEEERNNQKVDL